MNNPSKEEIYAFLGPAGAMISGSKSLYRKSNPLNVAVFNANVCFVKENVERKLFGLIKKKTYTAEKIWWGDFDLTKNWKALKNLAEATGETVVLLYEMDGRFENEDSPRWEKFVYMVSPDGKEKLGESIMPYVMWTEDAITYIPEEPQSIDEVEEISKILQQEVVVGEPAPADVQPTSEQIQEATVALEEAIALVKEKTKELKEKKPRAPRKPKSETATAAAEKPARKPRKPKGESVTDSTTEVVKKSRAPRKKKENNG
jgi:hypothetical protein